jgi:hypothetical protein
MSTATQQKPVPAILVYGTPTSPDLTQASWFRAEDKQAAKAAAETLRFSVIEINTDAEKALTLGVHEGVLKGSGRMIIGSVSPEVYRRIEDYARKGAGADTTAKSENIAATGANPVSEQNMNNSAAPSASPTNTAAVSPDAKTTVGASSDPATSSATPPDGKPASPAIPLAASTSKPETPPTPWDALRVGARVLTAYWNEKREFEGFWLATVKRIDKGEFTLKWSDAPEYPPFKNRRKNIAILHTDFTVSGK